VPVVTAALAETIARFRSAQTQGVSNVMEAIALGRVQLFLGSTAFRVASSWIAIAGGLSIGREGPLIEVSGALGAAVGQRISTSLSQTRVLVAAGTAAEFSAACNTPFAASLFVLETIAGIAAPELLLPVMAATVGAARSIARFTVASILNYLAPSWSARAYTSRRVLTSTCLETSTPTTVSHVFLSSPHSRCIWGSVSRSPGISRYSDSMRVNKVATSALFDI
jgi:CIC family chloride channel protein